MGTILERPRKDGSIGYTAIVRLRKGKAVVFQETKTFDRRAAANAWVTKRERELADPNALEVAKRRDPKLSEVISQYISEIGEGKMGRTKAQVLRTISDMTIGGMSCSEIGSPEIVTFARSLKCKPQTVGNYMSHLAAVFTVARPAWGYPLDKGAVDDARVVLKRLGKTSRSTARARRPTLDELDVILPYFLTGAAKRDNAIPMAALVAFGIFSTRREEEICRIEWKDLDEKHGRVFIRDMKHPGEKIGNHVWCDLPQEAMRIALAQPRIDTRVFPYKSRTISSAFTRAMKILEVKDLRFHDLRHDGISRLFEIGLSIPRAAAVSGHRSWNSLKRYTHLQQTGDKYSGWPWIELIDPLPARGPAPLKPQKLNIPAFI